ncbi:MAG: cation transporter [Erysipelotrichaceae bacterium]|nr:cation transporter [Erysipelotrichaceae bacterium]
MVNFLAKLFIKDYKNVENEKVRENYGTLSGVFGIITNLILVVIKVIIGLLSASISIIADAINNLSDMGSSLLTIIGFKISSKPADKDHPYGHQRVEYIISLIIAMIIAFVGLELLTTSIDKIINPDIIKVEVITFIILGVAIVLKGLQGLFYLSASKKIDSLSLKASAKDSINDCISTSAVLIGTIISKTTGYNVDGIVGILVSGFIIYSAIMLIKETMSPLIGEKPDPELIEKVTRTVLSYPKVLGIHDVITHLYGPSKVFISLHVEIDAKDDILVSHDLIDNIEQEVKRDFGIELVIHMDPVETDNEELNKGSKVVREVLKEIDPIIMFHDFRMVKGETHTNFIFDVLVPFQYKYSDEELVELIKKEVSKRDEKYRCVILVDKDYVS